MIFFIYEKARSTGDGKAGSHTKDETLPWFFALLSNEKTDAIKALELYRNKDMVEKAFGNLNERLSMHRTLVSLEKSYHD